jgi:hypothetical protein
MTSPHDGILRRRGCLPGGEELLRLGAVMDHDMQRQIARERVEFLQRKALEQVDSARRPPIFVPRSRRSPCGGSGRLDAA